MVRGEVLALTDPPGRRRKRTRVLPREKTAAELRVDRICERLRERELDAIAETVARSHHVTVTEMLGTSRMKSIVASRHELLRVLHDNYGLSWPEIGVLVERRHDNIVHAGSKKESRARRTSVRTLEHEIAEFVRASSYGSVAELADAIASGAWRSSRSLSSSSGSGDGATDVP